MITRIAIRHHLNPVLLIAFVFGVLLLISGGFFYKKNLRNYQLVAERELKLINQLQLQNIHTWRQSRFKDAHAITSDEIFGKVVFEWLQTQASSEHTLNFKYVQNRLRFLHEWANYEFAYLVNHEGTHTLDIYGFNKGELPEPEKQALQQAFKEAKPIAIEPRHDSSFNFPFFSLIAPIYYDDNEIGAIWLVMDVRATLYPLLEKWPTASDSGESALVMETGAYAQVLSPLRHDAPIQKEGLKIPLKNIHDPMVQAIKGMRGLFYTNDYRGIAVIAAAAIVPDSPWYLVSKIDRHEVLNRRWEELLTLAAPFISGLLCIWLTLAYVQHQAWRRQRKTSQRLETQIRHDPLTGVANRLALDERLKQDWQFSKHSQLATALLMIDIDYFKQYNDYYGHVAGDLALKQVAQAINQVVSRSTDLVARFGGEEFTVLLPGSTTEQAYMVAEKIAMKIDHLSIEHQNSTHNNKLTISIGIACSNTDSAMTYTDFEDFRQQLLERADAALYLAKKQGRNQIIIAP